MYNLYYLFNSMCLIHWLCSKYIPDNFKILPQWTFPRSQWAISAYVPYPSQESSPTSPSWGNSYTELMALFFLLRNLWHCRTERKNVFSLLYLDHMPLNPRFFVCRDCDSLIFYPQCLAHSRCLRHVWMK